MPGRLKHCGLLTGFLATYHNLIFLVIAPFLQKILFVNFTPSAFLPSMKEQIVNGYHLVNIDIGQTSHPLLSPLVSLLGWANTLLDNIISYLQQYVNALIYHLLGLPRLGFPYFNEEWYQRSCAPITVQGLNYKVRRVFSYTSAG